MFKTSSIDKSNIGMESLTREYKEVFLHCIEKYFTEKDLIEFIKINKINEYKFNKAISTTIRSYILSYLPKYIGAYNNAKIIGDLYFGIDDIGDKIGIPFFGTLNKKTILRALNQTHVYLRAYDNGKLNKDIIILGLPTDKWNGCYGVQSYINLSFLSSIQDKYNIINMIHAVKCRTDRCCLERIFGLIFCTEIPKLFKKSFFGDIMKYQKWGYTFEEYMIDLEKGTVPKHVVKVWTGR